MSNKLEVHGVLKEWEWEGQKTADLHFTPETEAVVEKFISASSEHIGKAFKLVIEILDHM